MSHKVTVEDLQGNYEISYNSSVPLDNWYEIGDGKATIKGKTLKGIDEHGVTWDATFDILSDGTIKYKAYLDTSNTPLSVGLMNDNGEVTRENQHYNGILKALKLGNNVILSTEVKKGPVTINVQFKKEN